MVTACNGALGVAFNVNRPLMALPVFKTKLATSTPVAPAMIESTYIFVLACMPSVGLPLSVNGPSIVSPSFKTKLAGLRLLGGVILADASERAELGAVGIVAVEGGDSDAKDISPVPAAIRIYLILGMTSLPSFSLFTQTKPKMDMLSTGFEPAPSRPGF